MHIKHTKKEFKNLLKIFQEKSDKEIRELVAAGNDSRDWKISKAKEDIKKTSASATYIKEVAYRLFDNRFTYYTGNAKGFHASPQFKVCKNMLFENIGLLLPRQISKNEFRHVFCTRLIPEMCAISTATKEQNQLFPLYLYPEATLTNTKQKVTREENFTTDFRNFIDKKFGNGISPEQVLGYIYAILHSKTYRTKYTEFLKDKFARIHFAKDKKQFDKISKLGTELIDVHLLESEVDKGLGDFIGKGSNTIETIKFSEEKRIFKLHINKSQYFNNVAKEIWEFQIGGYNVIDKFLKERKTRELTIDEVEKVTSIINALAFTIDQMKKIDEQTKSWI